MVLRNWQDQYELTRATVPQSVRKLLEVVERIEKAYPTDKECKAVRKTAKGGGSSKKRMVSFNEPIPKKCHMDAKHCALCKKHEGVHTTHHTEECHMYEDGTPKKSFGGENAQHPAHNKNALHDHNSAYAQFSVENCQAGEVQPKTQTHE